jgi:hypothetical protein
VAPAQRPLPEGLTPLEAALVETLRSGHVDFVKELRAFRWQMLGLVCFLVAIVALLKGVSPGEAAEAAAAVVGR